MKIVSNSLSMLLGGRGMSSILQLANASKQILLTGINTNRGFFKFFNSELNFFEIILILLAQAKMSIFLSYFLLFYKKSWN